MQIISWEEYLLGDKGPGTGDRGSLSESETNYQHARIPNNTPLSPSLAVTVGVFDGVHLGHQALIRQICNPSRPPLPYPEPLNNTPLSQIGRAHV